MAQYEIIYEDGSHSIAEYESDEEALEGVEAHHNRALKGEPALAGERIPAIRVVKVLVYENPPGQFNPAQTMSEDVTKKELEVAVAASTESGVTDLPQLAARIRDLSNPFVQDSGPHDSKYKMKESRELKLTWAGGKA